MTDRPIPTPAQRKQAQKFTWKPGDVKVQLPPNADEVEQEIEDAKRPQT